MGSAVQSALVDMWAAALPSVAVMDGPRVRSTPPAELVQVGVNTIDADATTRRSTLQPSRLSGPWFDEAGEVDSSFVAWSGNPDDLSALRARVDEMVDAAIVALQSDPHLGGLLGQASTVAQVSAVEGREQQTTKGVVVETVVTVSFTALLT